MITSHRKILKSAAVAGALVGASLLAVPSASAQVDASKTASSWFMLPVPLSCVAASANDLIGSASIQSYCSGTIGLKLIVNNGPDRGCKALQYGGSWIPFYGVGHAQKVVRC